MPRRPAAYPPAYREQIVASARAGRTAKELAREFELSEQTIRNWIFQAQADRGERKPRTAQRCALGGRGARDDQRAHVHVVHATNATGRFAGHRETSAIDDNLDGIAEGGEGSECDGQLSRRRIVAAV